eukprot:365891-Chlamydomonas_euryale.AAC.11
MHASAGTCCGPAAAAQEAAPRAICGGVRAFRLESCAALPAPHACCSRRPHFLPLPVGDGNRDGEHENCGCARCESHQQCTGRDRVQMSRASARSPLVPTCGWGGLGPGCGLAG